MRFRRPATLIALCVAGGAMLTGCGNAADVASYNLSKDADNFQIARRIVFVNGITDKYLMEIQGYCSIAADGEDQQLEVTCKLEDGTYKKHFLGLSDNVTYMAEQIDGVDASEFHYKVNFRPESIVPEVDLQTSAG